MEIKENIRKIWDIMEERDIASFPRPVHHRIPGFVGSKEAADRLTKHSIFRNARVAKVNPDSPLNTGQITRTTEWENLSYPLHV